METRAESPAAAKAIRLLQGAGKRIAEGVRSLHRCGVEVAQARRQPDPSPLPARGARPRRPAGDRPDGGGRGGARRLMAVAGADGLLPYERQAWRVAIAAARAWGERATEERARLLARAGRAVFSVPIPFGVEGPHVDRFLTLALTRNFDAWPEADRLRRRDEILAHADLCAEVLGRAGRRRPDGPAGRPKPRKPWYLEKDRMTSTPLLPRSLFVPGQRGGPLPPALGLRQREPPCTRPARRAWADPAVRAKMSAARSRRRGLIQRCGRR